jgi:arylsulfatase A-like enzyme
LLEGLAALGVADRTLVVVTSDHGEQFGEHGGSEHTYDLHDEVAHVPLIMHLPGAIPVGLRIAEPVSVADIVPTVVDLLGLPPVHGVDGLSLLPLLASGAERLSREGVFSEAASGPNIGWANLSAVHTRAVSCIHDARTQTYECWDRRRDPWQDLEPLPADTTSSDVAAAKALLAAFEAAKPPPGTRPPGGDAADIDAERLEQLRSLGYVE